jgi:SAM-dependent methyltransferase
MPHWGEIFAAPGMQDLQPNPELAALLPEFRQAGLRLVLDAGCGVGRHLIPLTGQGFQVVGVDLEAPVLQVLQARLVAAGLRAPLLRADLTGLPFGAGRFDLVLSINVINHGDAAIFREFCRELNRVLAPGGGLFIYVSPREFGEHVKLPHTRELEPGTLVHHFPTPAELRDQFPGYQVRRIETIRAPIPFMGDVELPQLIFWGRKG